MVKAVYNTKRSQLRPCLKKKCCGAGSGSKAKAGSGSASVLKSKARSESKSKLRSCAQCRLKNGTMEGRERSQWGLKMGPYRFCRLMDADLHHFDEDRNLDPDPDPHQSEKTGIRIRPAVEKFARYNF